MNYNESMIKKLITTKKSLPKPAPVSPYKDLPEFLGRGKPFAMWDRLHIDYSFFVNIPGKNENEPGTLKIMFYGKGFIYDLDNNWFLTLPKDWVRIRSTDSLHCDVLNIAGSPDSVKFFPADKYMQNLCAKIKIPPSDYPEYLWRRYDKVSTVTIYSYYLGKDMKYPMRTLTKASAKYDYKDEDMCPSHLYWVVFEKECKRLYQETVEKAWLHADKAQHPEKYPKKEEEPPRQGPTPALQECIDHIKKWGY